MHPEEPATERYEPRKSACRLRELCGGLAPKPLGLCRNRSRARSMQASVQGHLKTRTEYDCTLLASANELYCVLHTAYSLLSCYTFDSRRRSTRGRC
ncbi:hypothetical protein BU24DRAFT_423810 [Aaosphaeria arxii CBS 175.79]|uniref:Uncharacterized protein n=1 Tax=Aaosphaeria arxii CBS 175.79 TaxID=1450172 RepID=A0A6A5XPN4_9PLEO|nr:uncharacterized protein BU24DRAFT_423810 [Aaosphaeria arxii CBS 175.79]KAF2014903.1 hypothetical protein BU24DRAFT_423810 [Aaosphaeria arxii CBS 175.79]